METEEDLLNAVRSCKVFASLDKKVCQAVLPKFEKIALNKGEILFNQGDPSDCLYLLLQGKLSAVITTALGQSKSISFIEPVETVGELGALSNEPRSLTIKASKASLLFKLKSGDFVNLCHLYPAVMFATIHPIIARSQKVIQMLSSEKIHKHIAIMPANEEISLKDFSDKLAELATHLPSIIFLSDYNPELEDITPAALHEMLDKIERTKKAKHKLVYFLKSLKTPLAKLCFSKIDMIYVVAKKEGTPQLDAAVLDKIHRRKSHLKSNPELILLHPQNTVAPRNTAPWLQLANFGLHHHIRMNMTSDYNRLLRFIRGKAVGLVLGGGGTRGWAHLGVLKAIREAKIPIDIIGGTSVGGIIAACYAVHQSYEDAHEKFADIVNLSRHSVALRALTWPAVSLFNARNFTVSQQKTFDGIQIEDLWIPYFCLSTNLTQHCEAIHRSGMLWEKTRASASIPGVIPPMVIDHELHFDGGLLNNLPVDVMRQLVGIKGKIIAIELGDTQSSEIKYDFPPILTFTQLLLAKLGFGLKEYRFPRFLDTFLQALFSGSVLKVKQNSVNANLLISLNLSKFSMLHADLKQGKKLIEKGYQEAVKQIAEYKPVKITDKAPE